jgi:hypothetical protein
VRIIVNVRTGGFSEQGLKLASKEMDGLGSVGDFKGSQYLLFHPEQSGLSRYPLFRPE